MQEGRRSGCQFADLPADLVKMRWHVDLSGGRVALTVLPLFMRAVSGVAGVFDGCGAGAGELSFCFPSLNIGKVVSDPCLLGVGQLRKLRASALATPEAKRRFRHADKSCGFFVGQDFC